jgi:hypothetical protein
MNEGSTKESSSKKDPVFKNDSQIWGSANEKANAGNPCRQLRENRRNRVFNRGDAEFAELFKGFLRVLRDSAVTA